MLRMSSNITIGDLSFDFVNEVSFYSSWKNLTDGGSIFIPRKLNRGGETLVVGSSNLFKRGDQVKVSLGYFPDVVQVFEGYVSAIYPDSPFEIRFEDAAWLLKQGNITQSYETVTLQELLEDLCPIPFEAVEANLGAFRITRVNFAQVLLELQKTYGLRSWIRSGTLYCGLAYWPETQSEHQLSFQKNIISHNLEYRREDDVKIKVKAISIQEDNSKIEVEVGDSGGAQRTLTYFGLSEADLKATAERELPRFKFEGYTGSLTTFGAPRIQHGDAITLTDDKIPEREGKYIVDQVEVKFSVSGGYRQTIKLGAKI